MAHKRTFLRLEFQLSPQTTTLYVLRLAAAVKQVAINKHDAWRPRVTQCRKKSRLPWPKVAT